MSRSLVVLASAALTLSGCDADESRYFPQPEPPPAAVLPAGVHDGTLILPGGRAITPTGTQTELGGYAAEVVLHPSLDVVYVNNTGYALRAVQVVRRGDGALLQTIEVPESWHGLALSADSAELYVAGGDARNIRVYAVDPTTGLLTAARTLSVPAYTAGIVLSTTQNVLWTCSFEAGSVIEVDRTSGAVLREVDITGSPFSIVAVPGRDELYVTDVRGREVVVIDRTNFTVAAQVTLGGDAPMGLEARPDGSVVYVSVTDADRVVAIDPATRAIVADERLGESELSDEDGDLLGATSPAGSAYDPVLDRLYVARAGDNVVAVLNGTTLDPIATIPTAWYPTDVAIDGTFVAVTNGKGIGAGPTALEANGSPENKSKMTGTLSQFDVATLDLAERTRQSLANWQRPGEVFPLDTGDRIFPVPSAPGGPTPIEHIILIVRENKTYDSVLGDLAGTEADPSLLMWGPDVTPNAHALAQRYANHDNFYDDSESSIQGHMWLTYNFVNHYMEHISYLEDYRGNGSFGYDAARECARPDFGSYFQHLIRNGIDFRIFGEVVGQAGLATDPSGNLLSTSDFLDFDFPGLFYNTGIKDELKAEHVAAFFRANGLPRFSFVLLPNDHTNGLAAGTWTPRSMIADNDYATGLLVDAVSRLPEWESTAIFIVQDDTQSGADHVDLHRSLLLVASPWARHGATSHVHTSYPSLFRTFNHILGIGPLNRYDAVATPLYDSFQNTPDFTPFTVLPRVIPEEFNPTGFSDKARQVAAHWSSQVDFGVPDATPALGDILWVARYGEAPEGSVLAQVIAGEIEDPGPMAAEGGDDDEEEYREAIERFRMQLASNPWMNLRMGPNGREALRLMPR